MIGTVKEEAGVVLKEKNFKTVKKILAEGDQIPKHNHPGNDIVFIVVKGAIEITLDESEKHLLTPGKVLSFNGEHFIQGLASEATELFVTLINEG